MKNKASFSFYRAVCLVSALCLLFPLPAAAFRAGWPVLPDALSSGALAGAAVLLLLPISEEQGKVSFWFSLGMAAVCSGGIVAALPARVWLCGVLLLHLLYCTVRAASRYSQLRLLFRHVAVWYNVENHARMYYSAVLYLMVACFPAAGSPAWARCFSMSLSMVLYGLLWARVRTGRTGLISPSKESEIRELIQGNLRTVPPQAGEKTEDLAKMTRVYERVSKLMEQKRPFLDADFSLSDMASSVFTNKSYLSKTINILSGRNFSQFVNYYRIRYCADLLRKDPHLRLSAVAMMSGFHSTVSFNMAFKLNMGETPSSFKERLIAERQLS